MGPIGIPELIIILGIVILLFGATRLPQIGRGLGEGISNFKKGLKSPDNPERLPERAEEKR
ncbi:MAG TPA: twin-arginine translocase TatA/TatE family subunit [Thermoanaerobaculia bacterium]|nr:twin-arginine translocase TatA/TatE family subunit [Thermoanaerobaculia bacterium]